MISRTAVGSLIALILSAVKINAQYGILSIYQDGDVDLFCARYVVPGRPLATNWDDAPSKPVVDLSEISLCYVSDVTLSLMDAIVVVDRFNCSVYDKALIAQNYGASGVVVVTPTLNTNLPEVSQFQKYDVTIPFAVISEETIGDIKERLRQGDVKVKPFIPADKFYFDFSFLFMWLIAMSAVTLGAFWTTSSRSKVATRQCCSNKSSDGRGPSIEQSPEMVHLRNNDDDEEVELFWNTAAIRKDDVTRRKNFSTSEFVSTNNAEFDENQLYSKLVSNDLSTETIDMSPMETTADQPRNDNVGDSTGSQVSTSAINQSTSSKLIKFLFRYSPYILLVVILTGQVLLMYYFFDYMVYYSIFWFCLTSTIGLYWCVSPFIESISCGCLSKPLFCNCNALQVTCLTFCVILPVVWCTFRHESFAWVLQDILGIALCTAFIGWQRVSKLKYTTFILLFAFFYDIFLVFVTPVFTSDGRSVMEKMIIGGSDVKYHLPKEEAPTVFKFPFVSENPMIYCTNKGYYILGFGDIIVPGLLFGCCHDLAAKIRARHVYMSVVSLGYGCGLILTDIVLYVSMKPQPALFYLVPCSLIAVMVTGFFRKEFKYLWTGDIQNNPNFRYEMVNNNASENEESHHS